MWTLGSRALDARDWWCRESALLQLIATNLPDAAEYEAQRERNHGIEARQHCESHGIPSFQSGSAQSRRERVTEPFLGDPIELGGWNGAFPGPGTAHRGSEGHH